MELQQNKIHAGYFDYIEDLIERENTFTMKQFASSANEFLMFRKYKILNDNCKMSKKQADDKAEAEYQEFNKTQKSTPVLIRLLKDCNNSFSLSGVKVTHLTQVPNQRL